MNLNIFSDLKAATFKTTWQSPSNIAFIKYWGKKGHQIPANPSLSMTLNECYTETKVIFSPADSLQVELYLDGNNEDKFAVKIKRYLESLSLEFPLINKTSFVIHTKNTFPHGTGIASSASGLSAFALCLTDYLYHLAQLTIDSTFYQRASYLSRLASGSACRSVYGGFTTWGEYELSGSSDQYASPFEVHPHLANLKDSVLVVSSDEKSVSSTAGHGRMNEHAFAEARFLQAEKNFKKIIPAMKSGDLHLMGQILESEALSLHAMMMTSPRPYTLLKPNTLAAIEMIWALRNETQLPVFFTLDAGPNLHLIYPEQAEIKIKTFISNELSGLCHEIIHDGRGEGPRKC